MLRCLVVLVVLTLPVPGSHAQSWVQAVTPTPAGLIITAGQWLWNLRQPEYVITVRAQGADAESQRRTAFRMAVEQAVGTAVLSTTTTNNGRLSQDQISTHAAAYVHRYKIISQDTHGMVMQAWVRPAPGAQVALTGATAQSMLVPVQTQLDQLGRRDAWLAHSLQTFPAQAFSTHLHAVSWQLDPDRRLGLHVRFAVTWNHAWRDSWITQVRATGTDLASLDAVTQRMLVNHLVRSRPQVLLQVRDAQGQVVFARCQGYAELDHLVLPAQRDQFVSYEPGRVDLNLTQVQGHVRITVTPDLMARYNQVQLQVTALDQCP